MVSLEFLKTGLPEAHHLQPGCHHVRATGQLGVESQVVQQLRLPYGSACQLTHHLWFRVSALPFMVKGV